MIRKIRIKNMNENQAIPRKVLFLQTLVLDLAPAMTKDIPKTDLVQFTLKVRARAENTSATYKLTVQKFSNGTPREWIEVLRALEEIWRQNSLVLVTDRYATIKSIVREDSFMIFDAAVEEARRIDDDEAAAEMTTADVETGLDAVRDQVFPFRALDTQQGWMKRNVVKPVSMTCRNLATQLTRMNNALALFPDGNENSKFSPEDLLEILESSLPLAWRSKFDADGYTPKLFDKAKLIEKCEAIE